MKSYLSHGTLAFISSLTPDQLASHYGKLEALAPGFIAQLNADIKVGDLNAIANLLSEGGELSEDQFDLFKSASRKLSLLDRLFFQISGNVLAIQNLLKAEEPQNLRETLKSTLDDVSGLFKSEISKAIKKLDEELMLTHTANCSCFTCHILLPEIMSAILDGHIAELTDESKSHPAAAEIQAWADERFVGLPLRTIIRDGALGQEGLTIAMVPTDIPDEVIEDLLKKAQDKSDSSEDDAFGFGGMPSFLDPFFGRPSR